jgi:probable Rubsico expression protein CbbX
LFSQINKCLQLRRCISCIFPDLNIVEKYRTVFKEENSNYNNCTQYPKTRPLGPYLGSDEEAESLGSAESSSFIDVRKEYLESEIQSIVAEMCFGLVGLVGVKARVRQIASLLLMQRLRNRMGLDDLGLVNGVHMSFTGAPGTGKTLVASRMASILKRIGIVERGHLVCVTRDDLVGQYIGHTAPKTRIVLDRVRGGVLLVDEAYNLYKQNNVRDYGTEVVEILLQCMESRVCDFVVIFAGYKPQMDLFFKCNPGLASRILTHIDFPDYTTDELLTIGVIRCIEQQYVMSDGAMQELERYIDWRREEPYFANVRTVENKLAEAMFSHAKRLIGLERTLNKRDLTLLLEEDFVGAGGH